MSFFINNAYAAAATPAPADSMSSIMMLVAFVLVFYLLLWMPQSKRAKEHRKLIGGLAKDDEVITNGGVLGRITKIQENFIVLAVAENVEICVQKSAVSASVPKGTCKSVA